LPPHLLVDLDVRRCEQLEIEDLVELPGDSACVIVDAALGIAPGSVVTIPLTDVPARDAALMAAAQRPITAAALNEPAGLPAWHTIRSYHLIAEADKNIPAQVQRFMAGRAHGTVLVVRGASHAVFVSQPAATASFIERAARETA
jgi:pimeloyl-ACP methyl ester carboxylesterase